MMPVIISIELFLPSLTGLKNIYYVVYIDIYTGCRVPAKTSQAKSDFAIRLSII